MVTGPINQAYQALLEQNNNAYENTTTSPTLYLIGGASHSVDGVFVEVLGFNAIPEAGDRVAVVETDEA